MFFYELTNIPWSSSLGVVAVQFLKHAKSVSHVVRTFLPGLSQTDDGQDHGDGDSNVLVQHFGI